MGFISRVILGSVGMTNPILEEMGMDKYMDQRTRFVVLHTYECQILVDYRRSPSVGSSESGEGVVSKF